MATQVPPLKFTDTGVSIPEETDVLDGVLADYDAAFGGGLNKDLSTPQGQLAQSQTAIIGDKNAQILEIQNQVDPERNDGRWQDAIGRIYFMERTAGAGTVVQAKCYGAVDSVISAGSLAQDTSGYLYASTADATIGSAGYVLVQFQNQTDGAIPCPVGTLTKIYISVSGWERIENETAGVVGNLVESRQEFEHRRRESVAINSLGLNESLRARLWQVPNVLDVYVDDNPTNSTVTKGASNYSLAPHSVYCCVAGGAAADIAEAIRSRKSGGCNMNGDTSYTIEQKDGYGFPYPQYTYRWQTAIAKPVFFAVRIANDSRLPADVLQQTKSAIADVFAGRDDGHRARIGARIYAGRYYSTIQKISDYLQLESVFVGFAVNPTGGMVELGIDQVPTLEESNISVTLV